MTTEHFTQALDRAAAAVRRSFVGEEIFGNDDFGHLKRDIAAMAHDGGRLNKTTIVALVRKLLVVLRKYVTAGVVIEGAIVKSA
jgi:transposase